MHETIETGPLTFEGPSSAGTGTAAASKSTPATTEQFVITRNAQTGDVMSIESIDSSGRRSALSEAALGSIAGEDEFEELEAALNEAFEAGVSMLFEEADDENGSDSVDRTALLRALVLALAGRQAIRRFGRARRTMFQKLVLRRLVRRYFLRQRLAAS
jgi:hypothetical protein